MAVDWNGPLATLCGDTAEFVRKLNTDDDYPMLVIITAADGLQEAERYRADGTYSRDCKPSPWDLVNITSAVKAAKEA